MSDRIVVIGGGIMGLGVAWRCAARGQRVTLLEAGEVGRESSWAAGGMLAPRAEIEFEEEAMLALAEDSQRRWPTFVAAIEEASGIDVGYDKTGTIIVAVDRDESEYLEQLYRYQVSRDLPVERLTGDGCRALEPLLSPNVHSGIRCAGDHQIEIRALLMALRQAASDVGVELREHTPVARVEVAAGAVRGVETRDGELVEASSVVVAAGAWSRALDGLEERRPPIRPIRGQMLSVAAQGEGMKLRHVVRTPKGYVIPKSDRWLLGSTMEERGFDRRLTAGGTYYVIKAAYEVLPAVYELPIVETWTGFRPASRDAGPIIGGSGVDGLFFCTGHFRNGLQMAPVSIDAVSGLMSGEPFPEEARPFTIERFVR